MQRISSYALDQKTQKLWELKKKINKKTTAKKEKSVDYHNLKNKTKNRLFYLSLHILLKEQFEITALSTSFLN